MAIVISGNGIDMGNNPVSNASQIDGVVINDNGSNVISQGELAYDVNTSSYIPNTLASGAIIERGSNANGEYIKYADGTLICHIIKEFTNTSSTTQGVYYIYNIGIFTFPSTFSALPSCSIDGAKKGGTGYFWVGNPSPTYTSFQGRVYSTSAWTNVDIRCEILAIGRWK